MSSQSYPIVCPSGPAEAPFHAGKFIIICLEIVDRRGDLDRRRDLSLCLTKIVIGIKRKVKFHIVRDWSAMRSTCSWAMLMIRCTDHRRLWVCLLFCFHWPRAARRARVYIHDRSTSELKLTVATLLHKVLRIWNVWIDQSTRQSWLDSPDLRQCAAGRVDTAWQKLKEGLEQCRIQCADAA